MFFAKPARAMFMAFFFAASIALAQPASPLVDATGFKVKLTGKPMRVVTLMPSLAELTADLLSEELARLIGTVEQSDYPPALSKVASVGAFNRFNLEKVLSLKPDLVLASTDGNSKDQVVRLRELGLTVLVVETGTFEQVANSMKLLAAALGDPARGEQMAAQFERGVDRIRKRNLAKSRAAPRVLLQIGSSPLVVAGANTFLDEALQIAGATNIYSDSTARYPRPSLEDAINRRPDVIVVLSMGPNASVARKAVAEWTAFAQVPAVKTGRVRVLQGDSLLRPTLRLLEGLSLLEKGVNE